MFAIAAIALYTTLRKRGTTRQLASGIVTCVVSALLLLPAIIWYTTRLAPGQAGLSSAEVEVALVYVAIWGWLIPLGVTVAYVLFTSLRTSTTSVHIPRQNRSSQAPAPTALHPPRHQPGVLPPYVFREDAPWGWLEYRGGRFQGQRLALLRSVITIGRDEDNDIWLDDEMASRHHAELAWDKGNVYITDCESLNGVVLNGRRIKGSAIVREGELLEIGSHRFLFASARGANTQAEQDDPLTRHIWRSADASTSAKSSAVAMTRPLEFDTPGSSESVTPDAIPSSPEGEFDFEWQTTAEMDQTTPPPQPLGEYRICIIQEGEMAGQSFALDRPILTVGRGTESDIVINDASISRRHAQFIRQPNGDYVQDLVSRNGTKVNEELLHEPRLLKPGDIVCVGNIHLEYTAMPTERVTPLPPSASTATSLSGPMLLRLPSKQKN